MPKPKSADLSKVTDFLFEVGTLARTPRSGQQRFSSMPTQSVAEHVHRVVYVGYVLAHLDKKADLSKVLELCLLHDMTETRVSDLNYIHQKYVTRDEEKALDHMVAGLPFANRVKERIAEYEARQTRESLLAKDADQIELLLTLKEAEDEGNAKVKSWYEFILPRLKTEVGKQLAEQVLASHSDTWWFGDKDPDWWTHRQNWKGK